MTKTKKIENHYNSSLPDLLERLYVDEHLSSIEITEKFFEEAGVKISARYVLGNRSYQTSDKRRN